MRAFIDLNASRLVAAVGVTAGLSTLNFKRGATAKLELQFFRDRVVEELPADASGILEMKSTGKYDGPALVHVGSWTKTGTGEDALYSFSLSFITGALDALFQVDGDPSNDVPEVTLMGEIQWTADRLTQKTQTFSAVIANDINRDMD